MSDPSPVELGEGCRPAEPADVATLVGLAHQHEERIVDQRGGALFIVDEASDQRAEAAGGGADWLHERIADPQSLVLVGTYAGSTLGYAIVHNVALANGSTQAKIHTLLVDPEAREVGIGEAMMNAIVDWAQENDCDGIDAFALPGDRFTKNFFESFGLKARLLTVTIDLTTD